jgi:UDP-2,3-diacylglucosamine pyrophosphatase LpxH
VLILISDLHLTDGTTAINVAPSALKLLSDEIAAGCKDRADQEKHLVLLGDIYDLVRTDYWLRKGIPREARPWGAPPGQKLNPTTGMNPAGAAEGQFKEILNDIIASPSGAALTALVKGLGAAAKVTYVIGNHDRVFNNFPSLQQIVRTALNVDVKFTNQVVEPAYGVAARHGHEWDKDCHAWEFITKVQKRRIDRFDPSTYQMMAIGEVVTAELMGGFVYRVATALDPASEDDLRFLEQIKDVNNLRPMGDALSWVKWFTEGRDNPRYLNIVRQALIGSLEDLLASALAREWDKIKTDFLVTRDLVDNFQTGLKALKASSDLASLGDKASVFQWIGGAKDRVLAFLGLDKGDTYVNGAREVFAAKQLPRTIQYIAYGHTHLARHDCFSGALSGAVQLYVNTGTYLPLIERTLDGKGYWRAHNMTMLFCYLPDRAGEGPTVDIWDGIRRKVIT